MACSAFRIIQSYHKQLEAASGMVNAICSLHFFPGSRNQSFWTSSMRNHSTSLSRRPNTGKPGYLFIGADNDGKPSGLHYTDDLQKDLAGIRSEGNILPQPVMQVYKVTLPEGDIAVIEVQPSKLPPVRFRGRIWIRVGARKAIANEEEERILMERREFNTPNFESEPCLSATLDDLDLDIFRGTRHVEWTVLED